jgi:hypothetical protein
MLPPPLPRTSTHRRSSMTRARRRGIRRSPACAPCSRRDPRRPGCGSERRAGAATIASAVRQVDARLVAEVAVDPDATWPESFGETGPDFALFEEFAGLTIVRGLEWLPTDDSYASCIVAIDTTELLNDSGGFQISGWACEAGSFPATLRFEVGSSQPQELRDRFGDGTGIEMIMRGDRIEVFADR